MSDRTQPVAEIISATGGSIVSRLRLQRLAYLLHQLQPLGVGFRYGPSGVWSPELAAAVDDAIALRVIHEHRRNRDFDGAGYSVFVVNEPVRRYEILKTRSIRRTAHRLAAERAPVLDIAAAAHWIAVLEAERNWMQALLRRKNRAEEAGFLHRALSVLSVLNLEPATRGDSCREVT